MAGPYGRGLPKHSSLPSKKGNKRRRVGGLSIASALLKPRTFITLLSVFFTFLFLFQGGFIANSLRSSSSSPQARGKNSIGIDRRESWSPSVFVKRGNSNASELQVGEGVAEITTKALYDKIAFDDRDGGAWKQGWDVRYGGSEWDKEKLKVFVVPHSHNDPGWIRTVEEYYQERTRHILDTVVASLLKVRCNPITEFRHWIINVVTFD